MSCFLPLKDVRCVEAGVVVLEAPVVDLGRGRLPHVQNVTLELVRYLTHREDGMEVCRRLVGEMTARQIGRGHFASEAVGLIDECRWDVHFRTEAIAMVNLPVKVSCSPSC